MKTLSDIWPNLQFGDILLVQRNCEKDFYYKPKLITVVGIDILDMAVGIDYINYKCFYQFNSINDNDKQKPMNSEIKTFVEWTELLLILGHWKKMPKFKNLLKAYRKANTFYPLVNKRINLNGPVV